MQVTRENIVAAATRSCDQVHSGIVDKLGCNKAMKDRTSWMLFNSTEGNSGYDTDPRRLLAQICNSFKAGKLTN